MIRIEKVVVVEVLKEKFLNLEFFYVIDVLIFMVEQVNKLCMMFFEKGIQMQVVKNILVCKVFELFLEENNYSELFDVFKGLIVIFFIEVVNVFVCVIKDFCGKGECFILKVVYIDFVIYKGDN